MEVGKATTAAAQCCDKSLLFCAPEGSRFELAHLHRDSNASHQSPAHHRCCAGRQGAAKEVQGCAWIEGGTAERKKDKIGGGGRSSCGERKNLRECVEEGRNGFRRLRFSHVELRCQTFLALSIQEPEHNSFIDLALAGCDGRNILSLNSSCYPAGNSENRKTHVGDTQLTQEMALQ